MPSLIESQRPTELGCLQLRSLGRRTILRRFRPSQGTSSIPCLQLTHAQVPFKTVYGQLDRQASSDQVSFKQFAGKIHRRAHQNKGFSSDEVPPKTGDVKIVDVRRALENKGLSSEEVPSNAVHRETIDRDHGPLKTAHRKIGLNGSGDQLLTLPATSPLWTSSPCASFAAWRVPHNRSKGLPQALPQALRSCVLSRTSHVNLGRQEPQSSTLMGPSI